MTKSANSNGVIFYMVHCRNAMVGCRNENFWYGSLQENYGLLQEYEKIVVRCRNYGSLQELWFAAGKTMVHCRNTLKIMAHCRNYGSQQELWLSAGIA